VSQSCSARWTCAIFAAGLIGLSICSPPMEAENARGDSWRAPGRASRMNNPIPLGPASVAAGRIVYSQQCLCCHGEHGRGDGSAACDLDPRPADLCGLGIGAESDGALFWKITTGKASMPSFETEISERDRWNVINYLRTLKPRPATVASTQE
jgi:mono/diheme cytochrome c family protein